MSNDFLHNEKAILLGVAREEPEAFRSMVIHYRPDLLSYIITYTKSREYAEEVVQDVFMQVWTARGSLEGIRNFRAFLFVVARNLALNAVRSQLREKVRVQKWADLHGEAAIIHPAEIKDEINVLEAAVDQLPPQQKKVWMSTRLDGKKLAEVAKEMKLSVSTVKKYVGYANGSITDYILKRGAILLVIMLLRNFF